MVQILQYISEGNYSKSFKAGEVDDFLKNTEARPVSLSPDLKINLTRVARGMYSLRSKRGIIHKGLIDPNIYDLRYLYASAKWILSELIQYFLYKDVNTAGRLVEFIQIPESFLIEYFGERRLVLKSCTAADELLVLLSSYYPSYVSTSQIYKDMNRRPKSTVANTIKSLYNQRFVERSTEPEYKLTILGYQRAIEIIKNLDHSN